VSKQSSTSERSNGHPQECPTHSRFARGVGEKVIAQAVTLNSAAAEFKVTAKTAAKWVRRYQQQGRPGLQDRSSRPLRSPRRCPQILPDQKAPSAAAFLQAAVDYYARLGISISRVLTDNGPCYRSGRFRRLCQLRIRQRFTRPYTPRTNGKAERFIQTALREWAYSRAYDNSQVRALELPRWLHQCNWHRPHASFNHAPPISRSGLDPNNLLTHTHIGSSLRNTFSVTAGGNPDPSLRSG